MSTYVGSMRTHTLDTMFYLPQDVESITEEVLTELVSRVKGPVLVVAGWECQDLSPAGKGAGLQGDRSGLLFKLVEVLGRMHELCGHSNFGYVVENVPLHLGWYSRKVSKMKYSTHLV